MNDLASTILGAAMGGLIGGGAIVGLLWHAIENRLRDTFAVRKGLFDQEDRPLFATVDQLTELRENNDRSIQRVHRRVDEARDEVRGAVSLMATVEDRVGDLERRQDRLEERHQNQWSAVTKDVSDTVMALRDVTKELREVSEMQRILFDRMERQ